MPEKDSSYFVHESSYVDKGTNIGTGTKIWHFCHVLSGTSIGKNCILGQNVMVGPDVTIGDSVKIQNNVSVYKGVTLEDCVFCGPSMVFTNVINPRSSIERKNEYKYTHVGKHATLGANCTIVCGCRIGEYAFVGAGAVVTRDIPSFGLATGVPARLTGWVCECGNRIVFNGQIGVCSACGKNYCRVSETGIKQV
ncbi:MAG: acyltransferase [Candidatus Wallbacteria bacterium]|nr:acyltransferase [Candidatus Wallbacteria bacterium]